MGATATTLPSIVIHPGRDRLGPGLEAPAIASRCRARKELRLLFVGNLIPRKGLVVLLGALARLRHPTWRLAVVGSQVVAPRYAQRVRGLAERLEGDRVDFRGAVTDAHLVTLMAESDLLVVPSLLEGFGLVYLEGMGFGLPAIASSQGGAAEIVRDGENGYLLDAGDEERLAALLQGLCEDRSRLEPLSLEARRSWERHPTWQEGARKLQESLASIRHGGQF
jgi:glycosyltransferase involved in cell wall biosynthesis